MEKELEQCKELTFNKQENVDRKILCGRFFAGRRVPLSAVPIARQRNGAESYEQSTGQQLASIFNRLTAVKGRRFCNLKIFL